MNNIPFISYAQNGEDVVLWRALGSREGVVYVDVGAFDPSYDSVTRALYERGWRGVNIEAQPSRIAAFERDRPLDTNLAVAIADRDGEAVLAVPANPGWASLLDPAQTGDTEPGGERIAVPVRRLSSVLADLGIEHVDVLKIDVEGGEPAVVRGLLDGPVRPTVCVVEGVAPGIGRIAGDEAVALLVGAGYVHCLFDGLNHYLTTDPSLRATLSVPASPADGYVQDLVHRLSREREALISTIAALSSDNDTFRRGILTPAHADEPADDLDDTASEDPEPDPADRDTLAVPAEGPVLPAPGDAAVALPSLTTYEVTRAPVMSPQLRHKRRRETLTRLLTAGVDSPMRVVVDMQPARVKLASGTRTTKDAVGILYEWILGRSPDAEGQAVWARRIEDGTPVLDLAREMAASGEALRRSAAERQHVRAGLAAWERLVAAEMLGIGEWQGGNTRDLAHIGDRIFVAAVYEVALSRSPSVGEMELEVGKLDQGVGREWLLRTFAAHPQTTRRLFGTARGGLRGRLRAVRYRLHRLQIFRDLVLAAESRRIAALLSDSRAEPGGPLPLERP